MERKKTFFHRTPLFAWNSPFIYLVIEVSSLLGSQLIKSCWIRSDPIVGVTDGSDCQIPSASLFNLISIRHNTETPSFSVVGSNCRFDDRIRCDSESRNPDRFYRISLYFVKFRSVSRRIRWDPTIGLMDLGTSLFYIFVWQQIKFSIFK
jgi:hypothetical protein